MRIFHISQNIETGYDTYYAAIVVAESAEAAKRMHPNGSIFECPDAQGYVYDWADTYTWAKHPDQVEATVVGIPAIANADPCVLCASFNAG